MSSPLDGRIRNIAREEAREAVQSVGVLTTTSVDTQGLQQQITDLHEHLHHLATVNKRMEERLDALEKASEQTGQETESAGVRRTRRKAAGE